MSYTEQVALEDVYVMHTFGRKPVEFVEGDGMTLVDNEGKKYLDFLSGIGVVSLGHCHPAVVKAVADQAAKLIHVSNYYYIEHRGEVARLLSDMLNAEIPEAERTPWKSFFANSGAEANECAIKLVRLFARQRAEQAGRPAESAPRVIVTLEGSFHGRTLSTLAATAQPAKQEAFQPLPGGFVSTPINDVAALEQLFAERGDEICAVMLECIQGESGVHPCTAEFLQAARRLTAERGALLVCDEVQCGMGITGKMWAWEHHAPVKPDLFSFGKKAQICGVIAGPRIDEVENNCFKVSSRLNSTWGGTVVDMVRSQRYLEIYRDEKILDYVSNVAGPALYNGLKELEAEFPNAVLASVVKRSGLVVTKVVESYMSGSLPKDSFSIGLAEGCMDISTWTREAKMNIPVDVREDIDEIAEKIKDGLIVINGQSYGGITAD